MQSLKDPFYKYNTLKPLWKGHPDVRQPLFQDHIFLNLPIACPFK